MNYASTDRVRNAWASNRGWALAVVVAGLAALAIGAVPAGADAPDDEAASTAGADASRETDRRDAPAKDGAADGKPVGDTDAARDVESEVIVVEIEPEQKCRNVRVTGSRVPKRVCTMVTPSAVEELAEAAREQRTEDYLRRRDALSNRRDRSADGVVSPGLCVTSTC